MLTGLLAAVTAAGVTAIAAPSASAAISSAGPTDPASQFPSYYADENGLKLQMCQDGPPLCLAGPEQIQDVHAAGGDAEAFYFHASAEIGDFTIETALEAAYADVGAGQENTFQRRQGIAQAVTPNGTYRFTDPYGSYTCTADASGRVQPSKGCRFETTPIPGNFTAALAGPIGPFLTWDTFGSPTAAPPTGYIGDGATPHKVVGSPTGFNKMRVSGPGITGTCTNDNGSTVANCQETDRIIVQGKVQPGGAVGSLSAGMLDYGDIPATPAVTKTLTYSNVGDAPITIGSVAVSGTGEAAFGVTNGCTATLAVNTRCTIDVTFTPEPGKASTATLTITDDTPVGTRTVALKGSNLPVMFVSDPAPPASLAFGTVGTGATSPEDNVVIGNSGNGPLALAASTPTAPNPTITGTSASHFRLGPNTGCTGVTVAPDGGCEIGVQFKPTTTGSKTANLRVTDVNGKVVNVPLTGSGGTAPAPDTTVPTMSQLSGSLTGTTADLSWGAASDNVGVTGYRVFRNGTQQGADLAASARSFSQANLAAGTYNYTVRAFDAAGNVSAASNTVTLTVPSANVAPGAPTIGTAARGTASGTATVGWTAGSTGSSAITSYQVQVRTGTTVVRTVTGISATARSATVSGLTGGTVYNFRVRAVNNAGLGALSNPSNTVTALTTPGAPVIGTATSGVAGGTVTATANWAAPSSNGGSAITGYVVRALRMSSTGTVLETTTSAVQPATARSLRMTLKVTGNYRFTVQARNAIGSGLQSTRSNQVVGR